jgi:ribosomal protein S12 methylthiotransferase
MTGKVGFISLGCPKALVDSEQLITALTAEGYTTADDYSEADVVVVNTCGFIDAAIEESFDAIEEAMDACGKVVVTGCLGARKDSLQERYPELLSVSGPQDPVPVVDAVRAHVPLSAAESTHYHLGPAGVKLTPAHYAYLKVAEGCNHTCSFCIIPSMRGKLRSRALPDLLEEADRLAEVGVEELLVISQDTSAWGTDLRRSELRGLKPGEALELLCRELAARFPWVRLHYLYPYPHVDQLLDLMAEGCLLPYLDVPLQHADPAILKAMRRPAAAQNTLDRLARWRDRCPEVSVRSTFIVGFPGEGQREFEALLEFLEAAELDRVGCFAYSNVAGAGANNLPDQVPEPVKQERIERLMTLQARISREKLARKVGQELEVIVDAVEDSLALGRTRFDAPDVDGVVRVHGGRSLVPGERTWVRITGSDTHDLDADYVGNPLKFA